MIGLFRGERNSQGDGRSSSPSSEELNERSAGSVETPDEDRRPRGAGWLLLVAFGVVVLVVVVFGIASLRLFVLPQRDQPRHADGIVSFAGSHEEIRTSLAVSLAEKGYAHVLLFSQGGAATDTECPKVPRVSVICFVDTTNNTRGEAQWAGRYAERHHWKSILIVPGRAQATRARLLTARCFSGQIIVVPTAEPRPPASVILHEWGGVIDALLFSRGC